MFDIKAFASLVEQLHVVDKVVRYWPVSPSVDVCIGNDAFHVEHINGQFVWQDFTHTTPLGPTPASASATLHALATI